MRTHRLAHSGNGPAAILYGAPALLIVILSGLGWRSIAPNPDAAKAPAPAASAHSPLPQASAAWWSQVRDRIERGEYGATPTSNGLQSPNRVHDFRTLYRSAGIDIIPRRSRQETHESWRFSWRTTHWGRFASMQPVEPVTALPESNGSRVSYTHAGLVEWYENTKEGLEQGFTLAERPAGDGPLVIEGCLGGGLRPGLREDGEVDLFDEHGAGVLHYGKLAVRDAQGGEVESHLTLAWNALAIVIEDCGDATYPLTVDPLVTSPSWSAESNQSGASFGISVATAGDVNGDGFSDVIVGARDYDNGQANEGRAYVFHGSPAGLSTTPAWTSEADQVNAFWGNSVETAGDVNGDGYSDVIIGAPNVDNGQSDEGRAVVYHGSPSGLTPSPAWIVEPNQAGASFGVAVATAGDVNGDGYSDVIVGAYLANNGQADEGRAFAYYGSPAGLATSPSWTAESNQAGAGFGVSVGTAGDVNADGYDDVVVGAYFYDNGQTDEGRAFVYHGSASGLAATPTWTAESDQVDARLGADVATAGDVNGDGYTDVIVGAYFYDNGQTNEGRAFVYHGSAAGLDSVALWSVESNQNDARLGLSVATAGDVNGDGYADVIIGAPLYEDDATNEGRAFLYEGSAAGLTNVAVWAQGGRHGGDNFGVSVATAGDVNGDGYSDVIIGAYAYDNGETDEGGAFVYHGIASGLATLAGWTGESNQAGAQLGYVASAGDVNGDGYSDVLVGARLYNNGETDEGRAFVFHGSPTGLSTTPAWTAEPNQQGAQFGYSLGSAGDVNGDGYSDVIVGTHRYSNGESDEGRAYVYHGSPSGLAAAPSWTAESNQAGAEFAFSVGTAGDVNGDGFSDVIVGSREFDNGQFSEGRAFVYHGSASGLAAAPAWTAESNQGNARFGWSVATAGDVNGDGFSDVIIGANLYSNGEASEGRAYVYHGSATGLAASPAWTAESNQIGAGFGNSVSTAGDVNGDGFSDIIVGASGYSNGESSEGRAFAYYGSVGGVASNPSWIAESNQALASFGYSVAAAGDVNGDGFSDVVVGAWQYDGALNDAGRAFVYHGSAAGLSQFAWWIAESGQFQALFGVSVAGAGDVNGDGFSDVVIGANLYDNDLSNEGRASVYYGNDGDGLDRIPRQARVDNTAPIDLLGLSDSPSGFRIKALGRTPAGRGRVRLQYEIKPHDVPFNGTGISQGPFVDTGAPGPDGSAVTMSRHPAGLNDQTLYHWRMRLAGDSPFFPRSRWLWIPGNSATEADFRTSETTAVAEGIGAPAPHIRLEPGVPNPFASETRLSYTLAHGGRHRIAVYDVQGRQVALLADQMQGAGRHSVRWDGSGADGRRLASGIYFIRLDADGRSEAQKVTLTR